MPFLDRDLVSFVSRLPDRYRLGARRSKEILRSTMAGRIPNQVLTRRKNGFNVPMAKWFRAEMKDYVQDHLCSPDSVVRTYLNAPCLDRIVSEHMRANANHEKLLWTLVSLEAFHREFRIGPPSG